MRTVYLAGIPRTDPFVYLKGMTILNVRLENAKKLASQVGGQSRFAERMNMSRQQASHIIGAKPHKGIGHTMARRIESVFDVPVGWLDIDHNTPATANEDSVDVPLLSGSTSVATSAVRALGDEPVKRMLISKRWLKLNVQASAFEYLALLSAMGDSMEPTFSDGSVLLIDRGVSSLKVDGVYVLCRHDELYVKRVQRMLDGSIVIKSDNPAYSPVSLERGSYDDLLVLGRVLVAWTGKKL